MTVIAQYDNLTAGAWAACSPFQLDNATENQKENENAPNLRFSRSDLLHQSLSWFMWHTLEVLDRTEKDASPSEVIHPQLPRVGIIPATCANLTINYLKTHFFIKKGKKLTLNACKR